MKWGDLISLEYGKPVQDKDRTDGKYPVFGTNGQIGTTNLLPLCNHPSMILGRKGAYRGVHYSDGPCSVIDTAFYTELRSNKVDMKWVYYKFLTYDINQMDTGSAIPSTDRYEIYSMDVEVPPIEVQRQAVHELEILDQKIRVNKKINDNLTQQIKLISDKWLKKCISLYNNHSSDVEMISLSQIANFYGGYSYKSEELQKSDIAMLTIKNFNRKGGFKTEGYKEIIPLKKLKNTQFAEPFDIFIAHTDLTQNAEVIGNAELLIGPMKHKSIIFSMDLVKVTPKSDNISKFLLAAILQNHKFKEHCLGYINGTTVLHLSKKALSNYQIILPKNLSSMAPLNSIIESIYQQISANLTENLYLESLRNNLLLKMIPKGL